MLGYVDNASRCASLRQPAYPPPVVRASRQRRDHYAPLAAYSHQRTMLDR